MKRNNCKFDDPDWRFRWAQNFATGMAQKGGERIEVSPEVIHALEAADGIPDALSHRWDATIKRFLG